MIRTILKDISAGLITKPQTRIIKQEPTRQIQFPVNINPEVAPENYDNLDLVALTSSWIYSDISLIVRRVTSRKARIAVKRLEGEDMVDIDNHPFERLLASPNNMIDGNFLRSYMYFWLLLRGEAYAFISTPGIGTGEPEELWPLPSNMVWPLPQTVRPAKGQVKGFVIDFAYQPDPNKQPERLPGENIVFLRFPNPMDYWRGLSPLSAARLPLLTDRAQAEWLFKWYNKKNAHPTFIASVSRETSDYEYEVAREEFFQQFKEGIGTAFVRAGDLSIETVQQTIEQMRLLEARQFSRNEIDDIYGVPAGVKGEAMSGDSRQAAETMFAQNTIQPLLDMEAAAWSLYVVRRYYGEDLIAEAPSIVPRDRALEIQSYNIMSQDRTIAENRAEQNLPELEDLPEFLQDIVDKVPIRLLNVLTQTGQITDIEPPSMVDAQTPEQAVEQEAMRSIPDIHAAAHLALTEELKRWKKVAIKSWKENKQLRVFETDILPLYMWQDIQDQLMTVKSEQDIRNIFDDAISQVKEYGENV